MSIPPGFQPETWSEAPPSAGPSILGRRYPILASYRTRNCFGKEGGGSFLNRVEFPTKEAFISKGTGGIEVTLRMVG